MKDKGTASFAPSTVEALGFPTSTCTKETLQLNAGTAGYAGIEKHKANPETYATLAGPTVRCILHKFSRESQL